MHPPVIRRWDYDSDAQTLEVEFTSGRLYLEVPENVAAGLVAAGSKGSSFNRQIRDRFAFELADERWLPE